MTVQIPSASGVPGIGGPPDWFTAPPAGSYRLDDVRWRGATTRTFGGGASQSASLRATQLVVGGQQFIYLSFRAAFVQQLADQDDIVYIGLQRTGGADAMVVRVQVHGAGFAHAGPPPDSNPPANVAAVQISTLSGGVWTVQPMSPSWIATNARAWLQSIGDVPTDPNNRWAMQIRIPAKNAGTIVDNAGPNLGTDFAMWYVVHASTAAGPVILADNRVAGATTETDLLFGTYPMPAGNWDQYQLTSGPASTGGVAIQWGDVVVQNSYGEGWKIANHASNTFVARPRNYTPNSIPAGNLNATFRIANWGSVAGDPNMFDLTTGVWDYVPGNSETTPVNSSLDVPALPAAANPPATSPIALAATMHLGAGKSLHQCILVTLSGTNLTFLNDSIYQNMNFDHASLLVREAEISIVGLEPFSPVPRDVYLAVEKVNMLRNTPPGTDEGQFLVATMNRLIHGGGPLAEKLRTARSTLSESGDYGSSARLDALIAALRLALAGPEGEHAIPALDSFLEALGGWLSAVKPNGEAAERLALVFDALASLLSPPSPGSAAKLDAFISRLDTWLRGLGADQASTTNLPTAIRAFFDYLVASESPRRLTAAVESLMGWLLSERPAGRLPEILQALRSAIGPLASKESETGTAVAVFSDGVAAWLRGAERLDTFVQVLSDVGVTTDELDLLFPTLRIHVYHDTGERVTGTDGNERPVLRAQSTFGLYTYHEGDLEGWQTSIEGAQRIAENLYLLAVPNDGTSKVKVKVQAVERGDDRMPEDPIKPVEPGPGGGHGGPHGGCLHLLLSLFGIRRR